MPMWGRTDTPLDNDSVDRRKIAPYALGLEDFICNCETPMTVGIQGEWGSGKTSLMRRIQQRLEPAPGGRKGRSATPSARSDHHKGVMTFWFDTWQYGAVGHADHLGLLLMRDRSSRLIANLKDRDMVFAKWHDSHRAMDARDHWATFWTSINHAFEAKSHAATTVGFPGAEDTVTMSRQPDSVDRPAGPAHHEGSP